MSYESQKSHSIQKSNSQSENVTSLEEIPPPIDANPLNLQLNLNFSKQENIIQQSDIPHNIQGEWLYQDQQEPLPFSRSKQHFMSEIQMGQGFKSFKPPPTDRQSKSGSQTQMTPKHQNPLSTDRSQEDNLMQRDNLQQLQFTSEDQEPHLYFNHSERSQSNTKANSNPLLSEEQIKSSNMLGELIEMENNGVSMFEDIDSLKADTFREELEMFNADQQMISEIVCPQNDTRDIQNRVEQGQRAVCSGEKEQEQTLLNEGHLQKNSQSNESQQMVNSHQLKTTEQSSSLNGPKVELKVTENEQPTQSYSPNSSQQVTLTLNQQSMVSKVYSQFQEIIETSNLYRSFLSHLKANQTNYQPYYQSLKSIFLGTKQQSNKSIQNVSMYMEFFKAKCTQLEKYIRQMQNPKVQEIYQGLSEQEINNLVYVDSKVVLRDIHEKSVKKVKRHKAFYKQVARIKAGLCQLYQSLRKRRSDSEKRIAQFVNRIERDDCYIQELIKYMLSRKKISNQTTVGNSSMNLNEENVKHEQEQIEKLFPQKACNIHVKKDRYLQVKFLKEKQTKYLSDLTELRVVLIKYLTSVFLTEEIMIASKIKESLVTYTTLMLDLDKVPTSQSDASQVHPQIKSQENQLNSLLEKKDNLEETKIQSILNHQLGASLKKTLPIRLLQELGLQNISSQQKTTSEELLEALNEYYQNEIFMKNIEIDEQFIFYQTKGIWMFKDEYQALEEAEIYGSKSNKANAQIEQTKIIISTNKYLHLERGDKIATIKLSQIKVSKKGRFLILSDRGKGIVGFIVNNGNQLGRIKFENMQEVEAISAKIKEALKGVKLSNQP